MEALAPSTWLASLAPTLRDLLIPESTHRSDPGELTPVDSLLQLASTLPPAIGRVCALPRQLPRALLSGLVDHVLGPQHLLSVAFEQNTTWGERPAQLAPGEPDQLQPKYEAPPGQPERTSATNQADEPGTDTADGALTATAALARRCVLSGPSKRAPTRGRAPSLQTLAFSGQTPAHMRRVDHADCLDPWHAGEGRRRCLRHRAPVAA